MVGEPLGCHKTIASRTTDRRHVRSLRGPVTERRVDESRSIRVDA
jgi:hypothetical protein